MERELNQIIHQKIADALAAPVPAHTRRDVHLPGIKGKARAVIGMRRSGKTTFLWQCLAVMNRFARPLDLSGFMKSLNESAQTTHSKCSKVQP